MTGHFGRPNKIFNESPRLLAKQVEIFVPKDPEKRGKIRLWFDNFIMKSAIPISASYPESDYITNKFPGKTSWENIVYGYSIYDAEGHFIGASRRVSDYFPEDVMIIKLILTNYVTESKEYEELKRLKYNTHFSKYGDNFSENTEHVDVSKTVNVNNYEEYVIACCHLDGIIHYVTESISNEIMQNEYQIWFQSWLTSLSIKFKKPDETKSVHHPSDFPIVLDEKDRKDRYGHNNEILCVVDYVRDGEENYLIRWYANEFVCDVSANLPPSSYLEK